ncbi:hypothetical protein T484DRAFT_1875018 [Baffinella frigidus]|nr:hypothetical protein T484DRAFT_1875018 [Cryptophyta sp. CCMP2293]
MAAAGAERTTDADMQGLKDKKAVVRRVVSEALCDLLIQGQTQHVKITLSRHYKIFMGVCDSNLLDATADDWQNILCEGLGTKFHVDWYRTKYSRGDLRVLRLGEPIFDVMMSHCLNPDWDGTRAGDFTITVVDEAGAKLALAMALHPRLGSESPLSLTEPGLVCLIADLAVDFSGGQDGGARAR